MAGTKLNLQDAFGVKGGSVEWKEAKGKDSSGTYFSWQIPVVFTIEVTESNKDFTFAINTRNYGTTGNYQVDFGNGVVEQGSYTSSKQLSEYYNDVGTYQIRVTSSVPFTVIRETFYINPNMVVSIDSWYNKNSNYFGQFQDETLVQVPDYLPENFTTLQSMFLQNGTFNGSEVSTWDTSNITSLNSTFYVASAFNQDLSSWNVGNVTTLYRTFRSAVSFNQDLSSWDTSKVTNMEEAFYSASAFNGDVSTWDTGSATNMKRVFYNAVAFNQNISGWDTSNVTSFEYMFRNAEAFNQDISGWDTSSATNMLGMFMQTELFDQDISSWDLTIVTTINSMFYDASAFNQDVSSWNTVNVTDMSNAFRAPLFNQDLGSLPINKVTNMTNIFTDSVMSTENYSRTLIGWANAHYAGEAKNNVPLGAVGITYNNTAYTTGNQFNDAASARAYLVGTANWTITDGGQV